MFVSKWIKLLGHYIRYPVDVFFLPLSICFGYFHGLLKLYAMFTLDAVSLPIFRCYSPALSSLKIWEIANILPPPNRPTSAAPPHTTALCTLYAVRCTLQGPRPSVHTATDQHQPTASARCSTARCSDSCPDSPLDSRLWALGSGLWALGTGLWALVTGHWSLVTGHW